jgi:hypothetical protein
MNIIERGKHPKNKLYTVRCRQCETKFEFEKHEAKMNYDQRDGDYVSIACPVCKTECTHSV